MIVQNLLQFSRRRDPKREPLDLIPVLRATLDLVAYELNTSGVKLHLKMPSSLPAIYGDANQIQQIFINLITNAQQAMARRPEQILSIEAGHTDNHVYIQMSDTGCGIAPAHISKIFDPFFTTKPVGQGTGLGLSICYGIVQQHGGKITASSKLDQGTTFRMELPIHE